MPEALQAEVAWGFSKIILHTTHLAGTFSVEHETAS